MNNLQILTLKANMAFLYGLKIWEYVANMWPMAIVGGFFFFSGFDVSWLVLFYLGFNISWIRYVWSYDWHPFSLRQKSFHGTDPISGSRVKNKRAEECRIHPRSLIKECASLTSLQVGPARYFCPPWSWNRRPLETLPSVCIHHSRTRPVISPRPLHLYKNKNRCRILRKRSKINPISYTLTV